MTFGPAWIEIRVPVATGTNTRLNRSVTGLDF
jgi:hypothetical protein